MDAMEETQAPPSTARKFRPRNWMGTTMLGVLLLLIALERGFQAKDAVYLAGLALTVVAMHFAERAPRPRRTYWRIAIVSAVFAVMLASFQLSADTNPVMIVLAFLTWAGITLLLLVWGLYYEQTEPLDGS